MSTTIGVYNYRTVGPHWGGGFPRSMTFEYTNENVKDDKIQTGFRKAYLGEVKADTYFGYGDTHPEYSDGIFLPSGLTLDSEDVVIIENQGDLYLIKYRGKFFYVMYSKDYHGWYTLRTTNNEGKYTDNTKNISFSVTAYNPNGSVLSLSSFSYQMNIAEAKIFFQGLNNEE